MWLHLHPLPWSGLPASTAGEQLPIVTHGEETVDHHAAVGEPARPDGSGFGCLSLRTCKPFNREDEMASRVDGSLLLGKPAA